VGVILDRVRSLMPWVKAQKRRNLAEAGQYLESEWKKTVSVPGSRSDRSKPGEPPRRQTGETQKSLKATVTDDLLTMHGSKVAQYLDEGTRRMAARPHRNPTLDRCRPTLLQILAKRR
jgi:hypothetical protein